MNDQHDSVVPGQGGLHRARPCEPGTVIGGYELLREIGRGGMAEVWVARRARSTTGKFVALKTILPQFVGDERYSRMFASEAEVSAPLSHSNIVQVFDEGEDDGRSWLVMEWVDGADLYKLGPDLLALREQDPQLRFRIIAYIIGQVLHGLSYAHRVITHRGAELGIVHRDISPQNILVSVSGDVKITDFGIAHRMIEETSGINVKGKLRYMSPEHLGGRSHDCTVDLYAVGAILHELLDGRRFRCEADDQLRLYHDVLSGRVPPVQFDVPPELEALRVALLQPDVRHRPQTADSALIMLKRWPGYSEMKVELGKICGLMTGVVRPRTGPLVDGPHTIMPRTQPPTGPMVGSATEFADALGTVRPAGAQSPSSLPAPVTPSPFGSPVPSSTLPAPVGPAPFAAPVVPSAGPTTNPPSPWQISHQSSVGEPVPPGMVVRTPSLMPTRTSVGTSPEGVGGAGQAQPAPVVPPTELIDPALMPFGERVRSEPTLLIDQNAASGPLPLALAERDATNRSIQPPIAVGLTTQPPPEPTHSGFILPHDDMLPARRRPWLLVSGLAVLAVVGGGAVAMWLSSEPARETSVADAAVGEQVAAGVAPEASEARVAEATPVVTANPSVAVVLGEPGGPPEPAAEVAPADPVAAADAAPLPEPTPAAAEAAPTPTPSKPARSKPIPSRSKPTSSRAAALPSVADDPPESVSTTRVKVHYRLDPALADSGADLRLGKNIIKIRPRYDAYLPSGTYKAAWRRAPTDPWTFAGTVTIGSEGEWKLILSPSGITAKAM